MKLIPKGYRERLQQLDGHLRFLYTVKHNPKSVNSEIQRRLDCIQDLQEQIVRHAEYIAYMKEVSENTDDKIAETLEERAKVATLAEKERIAAILEEFFLIREALGL